MLKGYIFELRESDGNDCTVYDAIVEAQSKEDALAQLADTLNAKAKRNDWESDGAYGYYFPCDCDEEAFECPGHGGLSVCDDPDEFDSVESAARDHHGKRYYHPLYIV